MGKCGGKSKEKNQQSKREILYLILHNDANFFKKGRKSTKIEMNLNINKSCMENIFFKLAKFSML